MPFDRFIIAPIESGLQTDLRPWLIPDDAFARLENAYVFRGRVRKRFGSIYMGYGYDSPFSQQLFSRLSIQVGTTNDSGNVSGTVPGDIFAIGQLFSIGDAIFTVYQTGAPANMLRSDGVVATATYNTTNGDFVIDGSDAQTPVYFYPAQPVMGIGVYSLGPINNQPTFAFDTQFAYTFSGGYWQRSGSGTTPEWHGTNLNYFWITCWQGQFTSQVAMFVTNFNATVGIPGADDDPIWYYNPMDATLSSPYWANFSNSISGSTNYTITLSDGSFIQTARIILPFKNRLVLLNTIEYNGTTEVNEAHVNRCRYSINGSPFAHTTTGGDVAPYGFLETNQTYTNGSATSNGSGAGFIDAATDEQIVSAEFIKDRLIVYFERSTWELVYTYNEVQPFIWQKINTELGSESPNSTVPFDKVVLTVGNTGIHACTGANVERIDTLIPDEIFDIANSSNLTVRVCGIRDYYVEMVYWAFPSLGSLVFDNSNHYPNRILVYNYRTGSWAFNDDCITSFGYYEQTAPYNEWSEIYDTWEDIGEAWQDFFFQPQSRMVIAGNQQGYVFIVNADITRNAAVMQITNIVQDSPPDQESWLLTIIDHTFSRTSQSNYISVENCSILTDPETYIFPFTIVDSNTIQINPVISQTTGEPISPFTGAYTGGAVASRVSRIDILSKQWNPYVDKGRNVYIAKIDFGVLKTEEGQMTIDYFASASELSMVNEADETGTIMGNNILETFPYLLYPFEQTQQRLWHPIYFQTDGECIQIRLYLSPEQIQNPGIALSDFQLEGMVLHTQPTSARLQ